MCVCVYVCMCVCVYVCMCVCVYVCMCVCVSTYTVVKEELIHELASAVRVEFVRAHRYFWSIDFYQRRSVNVCTYTHELSPIYTRTCATICHIHVYTYAYIMCIHVCDRTYVCVTHIYLNVNMYM